MTSDHGSLRWTSRPDAAEAVVLVLHGGAERSTHRNRWHNLHVLRLLPIADQIARAGDGRLAVARLLFDRKGWNGDGSARIADARGALAVIRDEYPGLPIAVVGHSLGGRVAAAVADDPDVTALVGLAPWIPAQDVVHGGPGLRALILHGTRDRITKPQGSQRLVADLQAAGADATYESLPGENHALLRHPFALQGRVAEWLVQTLLSPSAPGAPSVDRARPN